MSVKTTTLIAGCLLVACGGQAPADPGLYALMQVEGAQFYAGPMPKAAGGPEVVAASVSHNQVDAGSRNLPFKSSLGVTATAGLIGLVNDAGYWVLKAGAPDFESPDYPTANATLSFSTALEAKTYRLRVQGVDGDGHAGKPTELVLQGRPRGVPDGTLVVSLSWDTEADLDLHVVTPNGVEIFARNINSVEPPPPGKPTDPEAFKSGGILDFDSNAQCVVDGLRQENVFWTVPPPSGHYIARVDTFLLCGAPAAHWHAGATLDGQTLTRAEGTSGPADVALPHDRGGGVLAFEFDVP